MLTVSNSKWSRIICGGAALTFALGVVAQGLATVQAEPYGYVQADCPNIVKQAFDTVGAQCSKIARGKLCYGNSTITTEYKPGVNNVQFSGPGDTVDVTALKRFTLGRMDTTANSWGVAELKIKADLPDTDPSQAVTMILFGGVQLTDASADASAAAPGETATVSALTTTPVPAYLTQVASATNAALSQQATHSASTATRIAGLEVTATAQALTPTATGTISALQATRRQQTATQLSAYEGTATAAPIAGQAPPGKSLYSGLQAFYFQSSDSSPCEQAPHDGVLIQSPQNSKARVTLVINGATISLGSTIYITAQRGKFMTVNTLEGLAVVSVGGTSQPVSAGTAVQVALDNNLHATGIPAGAVFYQQDVIRSLPTGVLPDSTVVFVPGIPSGAVSGIWSVTETMTGNCTFNGGAKSVTTQLSVAYDQTHIWWHGLFGVVLTRSGQGPYTGSTIYSGFTYSFSYTVVAPNHITGSITIDKALCPLAIDMTRVETATATVSPGATP